MFSARWMDEGRAPVAWRWWPRGVVGDVGFGKVGCWCWERGEGRGEERGVMFVGWDVGRKEAIRAVWRWVRDWSVGVGLRLRLEMGVEDWRVGLEDWRMNELANSLGGGVGLFVGLGSWIVSLLPSTGCGDTVQYSSSCLETSFSSCWSWRARSGSGSDAVGGAASAVGADACSSGTFGSLACLSCLPLSIVGTGGTSSSLLLLRSR